MRRTKIVATLGPASSDPETIEKLIQRGMDVARLNFSHGSREEHRRRLETVRESSRRSHRAVACLQDLSGPKIRTGPVSDESGVDLTENSRFILTTDPLEGTSERVSTTYRELPRDVRPGSRILLDDGLIELEVEDVEGKDVRTRVISGGRLKSHKGINLPGVSLSVGSLTDKDREDAAFGIELDVDYMALSFVRKADDIRELKELLDQRGRPDLPVIAKIEKPEAVENLSSILDVADAVMVARGDLGVEVATEKVPTLQKQIIREANREGRPVITATQMLESMVEQPRPTRAEASDVANAILDGTDAIMLSAETAVGRHPVEAVTTMDRIARYTEGQQDGGPAWRRSDVSVLARASIPRAVAEAACRAADELKARYIVVFTESGATARLVSNLRPRRPILGLTPTERICHRLALLWGVVPIRAPSCDRVDEMLEEGLRTIEERGLAQSRDVVVMVFGTSRLAGATNMIKIHRF